MRIIFFVKKLISSILSVFAFPVTCISCGKQCYEIILCKECQNELYLYPPKDERCENCGVVLISEKNKCLDCREDNDELDHKKILKSAILADFESVFPIHQYTLWKKELLFAWKMANTRSLTPLLANLLHSVLQAYYPGITIVPVPPREGKIKKRGWDQVDDVCSVLHKQYAIPMQKLLKRLSKDEQKKRNRLDRLQSFGKNYVLLDSLKNNPKEVVIIDDVMTTGATLQSCASALKAGRVEHIHAITLFYV